MSGAAPKVSVAMVTYRHELFIGEAIESVLRQRTNFDFELVIGDDCSPDRTGEIVREYAAKYPAQIRTRFPERNEGLTRNLSATIGMCRGQYVAWLEGDDFWISSEKLQRQADYLDANPDCAWCFTRAVVVDRAGQPIDTPSPIRVIQSKYTLADYLRRIFQPRACTVMFRHRLFPKFPEWFYEMPTGDMPLHVLNAEHGDIGFIDETMATYRIHPGGVWSAGISPNDWNVETSEQRRRDVARLRAVLAVYKAVDAHLGSRYHAIMREQIAQFAQQLTHQCRALEDWPQMRRSVWLQLRSLPLPEGASKLNLVRAALVSHLPFLAKKSGTGL
jgi:glycosyltransferase involved in cell wall biosynthesis